MHFVVVFIDMRINGTHLSKSIMLQSREDARVDMSDSICSCRINKTLHEMITEIDEPRLFEVLKKGKLPRTVGSFFSFRVVILI